MFSPKSLAIATTFFAFASQASAFLSETSHQRVILIGKGGADSMQQVSVPNMPVSNQPIYISQNPYPVYSDKSTTKVLPTNSTASTPSYGYQNGGYQNNYGNDFEKLAMATNSAAVLVFDVASGKPIYEKNVDATRSIASVTKMMTAMVVLDSMENMQEELVIKPSDLVGAKTASTKLKAGDRLTRSEYMLMMLMKSENSAAKALASNYFGGYNAFIAAMNQKAQSLGMYKTRFSDSSGLDPRNVSSASDLAIMMREIGTNPRYKTIKNFSTATNYDFYITNYITGSRNYSAANTNPLVRSGGYPIGASKTGYIREAGYCVVMEAHVNGRPSIIVLLGANASQNRWKDAETIFSNLAYR